MFVEKMSCIFVILISMGLLVESFPVIEPRRTCNPLYGNCSPDKYPTITSSEERSTKYPEKLSKKEKGKNYCAENPEICHPEDYFPDLNEVISSHTVFPSGSNSNIDRSVPPCSKTRRTNCRPPNDY